MRRRDAQAGLMTKVCFALDLLAATSRPADTIAFTQREGPPNTTYGVTTSWLSSLTSEDVLEWLQWPLLAIWLAVIALWPDNSAIRIF